MLVYVVVDTPNLPGKEQAHSTFATEIFQKVMEEILPYMNIFPDTEVEGAVDENLSGQEEGITNNNEGGLEPGGSTEPEGETDASEPSEPQTDENGETLPEASAPQTDDEVVMGEDGFGLPDSMAGMGTILPSEGNVESMENLSLIHI